MVCNKCKSQVMYLGGMLHCLCKNSPKKPSQDVIDYLEQR